MNNEELYIVSNLLINELLLNRFNCVEMIKKTINGITYQDKIEQHVMEFITDGKEIFCKGKYYTYIVGYYLSTTNKFYPTYIYTYEIMDQNENAKTDLKRSCLINISNIIGCMIDMDNKYNGYDFSIFTYKNILQYEINISDKEYVIISLNDENIEIAMKEANNEGIIYNKYKIDNYKKNLLFLSEDPKTGIISLELGCCVRNKEVIYKDNNIVNICKYLESEILTILFRDTKVNSSLHKMTKNERKKKIAMEVDYLY